MFRRHQVTWFGFAALLPLLAACTTETPTQPDDSSTGSTGPAAIGASVSLSQAQAASQGKAAKKIPLWYEGELVTGNLLRGAEPGQEGFIPLPEAQASSSHDRLYLIQNNPNQEVTPEVIAHVPGDPEYTGGRWRLIFAVFNDTLAPEDRPNVTSVDQLLELVDTGAVDLIDAGVSFECPVVSRTFDG